ncbi:uncharacterized protein LOC130612805 [Hydractinia symbiolongicarpus]|uniref:uncharacterized protein LOC130612805 n=1 Tax=Hydractinia symbiolongicarpus TaxID=13093 RepID=UPI00254FAD4E|nr:uncharacterized protein LOC130612805 [Hydractinia symbiolongicarpus]
MTTFFQNSVFNGKSEEDNESNENSNNETLFHCSENLSESGSDTDSVNLFEQMDRLSWLEETENSDLSKLKSQKSIGSLADAKWSRGPAPLDDHGGIFNIKIASLEVLRYPPPPKKNVFFNCLHSSFKASIVIIGSLGFKLDEAVTFQKMEVEMANDKDGHTTANNALISYFAFLGTCPDTYSVDYQFINNLLKYADVNTRDLHGQSLLHEVAREWSTDFANFLRIKGIDINAADHWGRTPLIVASACNHVEMIEWLIHNGVPICQAIVFIGHSICSTLLRQEKFYIVHWNHHVKPLIGSNIDHRTIKGEEQSAIHFAAKYDAVDAFGMLIKFGANPLERDAKERTPFFVAAEEGQRNMCDYMLDLGLPTAAYDENAVSVIDNIIIKMPTSTAYCALDQFVTTDRLMRQKKYYLSCLGKRRFTLLERTKDRFTPNTDSPTALEIIVQRRDLNLITHPVILKLIDLKSKKFAKVFIRINVGIAFLYTLLWTATMLIPSKREGDWSSSNVMQVLTSTFAQFIAVYQFYLSLKADQIYQRFISVNAKIYKERRRILHQCEKEKKFCHPRWIVEKGLLKKKKSVAKNLSQRFFSDGWNVIDLMSLLVGTGAWIITLINIIFPHIDKINSVWTGYCTIFILLAWLRLNRYVRYEQSLGRFIVMLEESAIASVTFAFLFFEFFIPCVVAFWVLFGGVKKESEGGEYEKFNDLVYQLYLLAIVGDYDYDTLQADRKVVSQLLVAGYLIIVSTITVNLLIALFTEAFIRINETAVAHSRLREAEEILDIERRFPEKLREFEICANKHLAPMYRSSVCKGSFNDTDKNSSNRVYSFYKQKNLGHPGVTQLSSIKTAIRPCINVTEMLGEEETDKKKSYSARQALSSVYFKLRRFNPELNNIIKTQEALRNNAETGVNASRDKLDTAVVTIAKQNTSKCMVCAGKLFGNISP